MSVCNDSPVGAVHVGILDARGVSPVRPVDFPRDGRVGKIEMNNDKHIHAYTHTKPNYTIQN